MHTLAGAEVRLRLEIANKKLIYCLAFRSTCINLAGGIGGEIPRTKTSIRYYFAFSQKPRKLFGNNVTPK